MSSVQYNAGESHGQAQANTEQWVDSGKSIANSAVEKAENATQRASETAEQNKDQNSGLLQQFWIFGINSRIQRDVVIEKWILRRGTYLSSGLVGTEVWLIIVGT
ncbi:uncharacterized protein [Nicotiana tomentosiformis]|uniref:uncharacterized protein isoform X1 n=1 Tax=Nicotiana tomentosiformis TaxID=4098 RepID=UPI00388C9544